MAQMALGMTPELSATELTELSANPYAEAFTRAAAQAIESGAQTVRMINQSRTTFGDKRAAAALAALLEEAQL